MYFSKAFNGVFHSISGVHDDAVVNFVNFMNGAAMCFAQLQRKCQKEVIPSFCFCRRC